MADDSKAIAVLTDPTADSDGDKKWLGLPDLAQAFVSGDAKAKALLEVVLSGLLGWHAVETLREARMLSKAARLRLLDPETGVIREDLSARDLTAATTAIRASSILRRQTCDAFDDARAQWSAEKGDGGEGKETPEPKQPTTDDITIATQLDGEEDDEGRLTYMERKMLNPTGAMTANRIARSPRDAERSHHFPPDAG